MLTLSTNVTEIKGVGKTRALQLAKLGIYTVRDLIYYFPRSYENRADVRLLGECDTERTHAYLLTVSNDVSSVMIKKGMTISKFKAFDDSGTCEIVFFNSPFIKDIFHKGSTFRFYGKLSFSKARRLTMTSPKYEAFITKNELPSFVPIYSLTDGMTGKFLDKLITAVVNEVVPHIQDPLPEYIRVALNIPTLAFALKNIHSPIDSKTAEISARRLAFDEMLYFALGISMSTHSKNQSIGLKFCKCDIKPLVNKLPYELTNDQKRVINDIYNDTVLKCDKSDSPPMSRIVIGDVGSGKTICAIAAMFIASKSGYQSALMVPTEILANQHFKDISDIFDDLGIRSAVLTASTKSSARKELEKCIADGSIDVIIGTHALLSDKLSFHNLGLIVTDEQHRFGVAQRASLKNKERRAHMLVMSATPIPRTLALALYGDLDISRICEMPKGRSPVDTFLVTESYRTRINNFISSQVKDGGQCYIICPAIEPTERDGIVSADKLFAEQGQHGYDEIKNVTEYTEELKKSLPHLRISSVHGKMKASERDEIINRFANAEIDVLVSTTVIEVGINVPNANLMIIENADRYGLSQLHQIRGRVGRGSRKSYCILISDSKGERAVRRLEVLRDTHDGFEIAEKDLLLRGPGEFFSSNKSYNIRQSGGLEFKMASICNDEGLMSQSFETAHKILNSDPELEMEEHRLLKREVSFFVCDSSTIS